MTNERAIELLHRISDSQFDGEYGDERREALSMAVRALEQNLVKESGGLVKDLVKDCISRKMAIDKMQMFIDSLDKEATAYKSLMVAFNRCIIELKRLPSAQPETHDKRTETHDKRTETQINTLDCVSRQAAIDALTELRKKTVASDSFRLGIYYSIEEIKNVPSAQLDPQEIGYWECSNALLKMWIDNVLTDGEYYRIADKLNTYWKDKIRSKNGE